MSPLFPADFRSFVLRRTSTTSQRSGATYQPDSVVLVNCARPHGSIRRSAAPCCCVVCSRMPACFLACRRAPRVGTAGMLDCKGIRIANRSRWLRMHDITCMAFLIPEVSFRVGAECAATQNNKILANLALCFAWTWKQESRNELLAPACDACLKASFFEFLVAIVFHSFSNPPTCIGFSWRPLGTSVCSKVADSVKASTH